MMAEVEGNSVRTVKVHRHGEDDHLGETDNFRGLPHRSGPVAK